MKEFGTSDYSGCRTVNMRPGVQSLSRLGNIEIYRTRRSTLISIKKNGIGEKGHEEDKKENTVLQSQGRRAFQGGGLCFSFQPCYEKS